jgi:hypothetical protein
MYENRRASTQELGSRTIGVCHGILLAFVLTLFAGCGGTGGPGGTSSRPGGIGGSPGAMSTGIIIIMIRWPEPPASGPTARHLPQATACIRIRVEDANNASRLLVPEAHVRREPGQAEVKRRVDGVPVGPVLVSLAAFASTDCAGTPLAVATTAATVSRHAQTTVSVHLAAIETVSILPNPAIVEIGRSAALSVEARDASGILLYVPTDSVSWSSDGTAVATVNAQGMVTGNSFGSATVTATVTDDDIQPNRPTGTRRITGTRVVNVTEFVAPQITGTGITDFTNNPRPPLTARVTDPTPSSGIDTSSAQLRIDKALQPLSAGNFQQPAANVVVLNFTPPSNLIEGPHGVTLDIRDNAGNAAETAQWAFQVDTVSPVIANVAFGGFTASITDPVPGSGIDTSSAQLFLDNVRQSLSPSNFQAIPGGVAVTFTWPSLAEGLYTVTFQIRDNAGNVASVTGTFNIIR